MKSERQNWQSWRLRALAPVALAVACAVPWAACSSPTSNPNGSSDAGTQPKRNLSQTPGFGTPLHIGLGNFDRVLSASQDGRWALATNEASPSSIELYLVDTTLEANEITGPVLLGTKPDPMGHQWITRDGAYAIYTLNASGTADLHVDATAKDAHLFTDTGIDLGSLLVSNDQQWVAYTKSSVLYLLHVGDATSKAITTGAAYLPTFSPASHYLAWVGVTTPLSLYTLATGATSQVGGEISVFQFTSDDSTIVGRFDSAVEQDLVTLPPTGAGSMTNGTVIARNVSQFWLSPSSKYVLYQQLSTDLLSQTLSVVPIAGGTSVTVGPSQMVAASNQPFGLFTPDESGVVSFLPSASMPGADALYVASPTAGSPRMIDAQAGTDVALGKNGDLLYRDLTGATNAGAAAPLELMHVNPPSSPTQVGDHVAQAGVFQTVNGFSVGYGAEFTPAGTDFLFIGGSGANLFSTSGSLSAPSMRDATCASAPCDSPYYASYAPDGSYIYYLDMPQPGGIPGNLMLAGTRAGLPKMIVGGVRSVFAATPHGDILLYAVHSGLVSTGGLWRVDINM